MILDRLRLVVAFVLAPAIPLLLALSLQSAKGDVPIIEVLRLSPALRHSVFVFYAATAFIAVPAFFVVRRFREITGSICVVGGIMVAAITFLVSTATQPAPKALDDSLLAALLGSMFWGAICGFAFWKVAGTSVSTR